MHPLPGPVIAPGAEVAPHRRPGWKLMWQGAPLASGAIYIQDGIDDFSHVGRARVSSWLGRRDQRFQDRPFLLGQITGIASSLHLSTSSLFPFAGCPFLVHSSLILSLGPLPSCAARQATLSVLPSILSLLKPL